MEYISSSHAFHSGTSTMVDMPHCALTELAFTLKLWNPRGSASHLDKPSFVMSSRSSLSTLALKILLPFQELIFEPLDCLTHQAKSSVYNNSLHTPIHQLTDNIYINCKNNCDSTVHWWLTTLYSHSSDNSYSTVILVFSPSY